MPPSGPTTRTTSPVGGQRDAGQRRGGVLVQDEPGAGGRSRAATCAVRSSGATSGSQARRDCLPASRAVDRHALERLLAARPVPPHDATAPPPTARRGRRRPRSPARPPARRGRPWRAPARAPAAGRGRAARWSARRTSSTTSSRPTAATTQRRRGRRARRTGRRPRRRAAAAPSRRAGPRDRSSSDPVGREVVGEEDRRAHRRASAASALRRAGRTGRAPLPELPGALLAAQAGELAQQLLLPRVEPGRHLHVEVHVQVAAAGAAQVRARRAPAASAPRRAGCRRAMSSCSSPSSVSSLIVVPSAAAVIGSGTSAVQVVAVAA